MQVLRRRCVLFASRLITAVTFSALAQAPTPAPAFEVASVRLGDPNPPVLMPGDQPVSRFPTNRFYVHNLNLRLILRIAYDIDQRYIEGAPNWLDSENYSIDAKVEGEQLLSYEEITPLLRKLLAQRLGLVVHHESKLSAGYELVVAKGGPKLQPTKGDRKGTWPWQILPNGMTGWNTSTGALASMLGSPTGKTVIDHTGLTGSYDIKLSYAPLNNPNPNSNLPDIFTAIQEQLGLKLEPAKVPVDYLVIDHVDRIPMEN